MSLILAAFGAPFLASAIMVAYAFITAEEGADNAK
jgi:hypothetical protein